MSSLRFMMDRDLWILTIGVGICCLCLFVFQSPWALLLGLILGLFLVIKSSDWLEESANRFIGEGIIGALLAGYLVLAFGTSAGELVVSITGTIFHTTDLIVSNVTGSNLANLAVLGVCVIVYPIAAGRQLGPQALALALTAVALFVLSIDGVINWTDGAFLLLLGIASLMLVFFLPRSSYLEKKKLSSRPQELPKDYSYSTKWTLFIKGAIFIAVGAAFVVACSEKLALAWGVPEDVIGGTFVAIGTSLPELVVSLKLSLQAAGFVRLADIPQEENLEDSRRQAAQECREMVMGNLIGSNILNICFVLGLPALWYNFVISDLATGYHVPTMLGFSLAAAFTLFFFKSLNRTLGIILVAAWFVAMIKIFVLIPIQ